MNVLHYMDTYLPITCNWIYEHIANNRLVHHSISCHSLENTDAFPFQSRSLFCFSQRPLISKIMGKVNRLSFEEKLTAFTSSLVIKHQIDLLHAHFGYNGFKMLRAAKLHNIPLITTFYGADVSQLPRNDRDWIPKYTKLFEEGSAFIVEGPCLKQQLVELGCSEQKIHVNPLGIDLDKIKYHKRQNNNAAINILIAATFREKKGIPYALEALGILAKQYPNVKIHLVGDATAKPGDQEEKDLIMKKIAKYNLHNNTSFYGFLSNTKLHEIARKCEVFLSPSVQARDGDNEGGYPVSIPEMLASGLPVIATNHCDIPLVVKHDYNGYLVDERNVEQILNILRYLIDHPSKINHLGANGRDFVEKRFDVKKQAPKLGNLYLQIQKKRDPLP